MIMVVNVRWGGGVAQTRSNKKTAEHNSPFVAVSIQCPRDADDDYGSGEAAASLSVGMAVVFMFTLNCIHIRQFEYFSVSELNCCFGGGDFLSDAGLWTDLEQE